MYNSTRINRHVTRPARTSCALRSVVVVTSKDFAYRNAWASPFPLRQYEPDERNSDVAIIDRDIMVRLMTSTSCTSRALSMWTESTVPRLVLLQC
jgi:hypothetical protein